MPAGVRIVTTVTFALLLTLGASPIPSRQPRAAPDVFALLESYHRGAFDDVRKTLAGLRLEQSQALRQRLTGTEGRQWTDAVLPDRRARLAVAATFALDVEAVHAEGGLWNVAIGDRMTCAGRCVLQWAASLLAARGDPDEIERDWFMTAIALLGGTRDWSFVHSPLTPPSPRLRAAPQGLAVLALARFPGDARFRLARATAIASRYPLLEEMDAPRDGARTLPAQGRLADPLFTGRPGEGIEYALRQFSDLVDDPEVGAEARTRRAYLALRMHAVDAALVDARAAAAAATGADLRYLAWFIAGQAAQELGDLRAAEDHYAAALAARPHSQSASLAHAALRIRHGNASDAAAMIDESFARRPADNDPWRMFLYGDFITLATRLQTLREQVRQ
jgi:tetratricopeptide (TPR) repeat protein